MAAWTCRQAATTGACCSQRCARRAATRLARRTCSAACEGRGRSSTGMPPPLPCGLGAMSLAVAACWSTPQTKPTRGCCCRRWATAPTPLIAATWLLAAAARTDMAALQRTPPMLSPAHRAQPALRRRRRQRRLRRLRARRATATPLGSRQQELPPGIYLLAAIGRSCRPASTACLRAAWRAAYVQAVAWRCGSCSLNTPGQKTCPCSCRRMRGPLSLSPLLQHPAKRRLTPARPWTAQLPAAARRSGS